MNKHTWYARLPLPLLALSAAYGVYQFQALFTPWYVALLSAAAFEAVYLSLSFTPTPDTKRAMIISVSAVAVSVLYNTLSSLFHLRPALLVDRLLWTDIALAVLHGAPLAIVAYAVADLLLHRTNKEHDDSTALATLLTTPVQDDSAMIVTESVTLSKSQRVKQLAVERGVSETTIWRQVKQGKVEVE